MMKTFLIVVVVLTGAVAVGWYITPERAFDIQDSPNQDGQEDAMGDSLKSTPLQDGSYGLMVERSTMTWRGTRPLIEGYLDNGTVGVSGGSAAVVNGVLASGSMITVDATSISATSTGRGQGESRLTEHLRSDDWFGVQMYPTMTFVVTGTEAQSDGTLIVSGNLTIKGKTNPVSFPAVVRQDDDTITVVAKDVALDRTLWGVNYQSGSFFDDLGELLVADVFHVSITVVFRAGVPELIEG